MHACATRSRRRKQTTSEATKLVRTLAVEGQNHLMMVGCQIEVSVSWAILQPALWAQHIASLLLGQNPGWIWVRDLLHAIIVSVPQIDRSNSEYSERLDSVYHGDQTQTTKLTPSNRMIKNTTNTRILQRYITMAKAQNHEKRGPGVPSFIHANTRL